MKFLHPSSFLTFLLIIVSCTSPIPPPNKLGVHLLLDDGRHQWESAVWHNHLQHASSAIGTGGYVVELIRSDDLNVEKWQQFLDLCAEFNLIPVIRLATTFDLENNFWVAPPQDTDRSYQTIASQYTTFLADLNWSTDPMIIIGNEPNHGNEWSGTPEPANYARFLIDTASAIKN